MAGSNSYERGGQPRTVPDADAAAYEAMVRKQRAYNARQAASEDYQRRARLLGDRMFALAPSGRPPTHPGVVESLVPVWGSAREADADFAERRYLEAAGNAALAGTDLFLAGSGAKAIAKGAFKTAPPFTWKTTPSQARKGLTGARKWLGDHGYAAPGQDVHHWAIPQNRWGKAFPDWLKNQPWNGKAMPDKATHMRMDRAWDGKPQFGRLERYWHGSPTWAKAAAASVLGHAGMGAYERDRGEKRPSAGARPPPLR